MNEAQIEEALKNAYLVFSSYYKYTFTYTGIYAVSEEIGSTYGEEYRINASWGGNHEDVYRFKVNSITPVKLCPMKKQGWNYVKIDKRSKETGYEWVEVFTGSFDW